MVQLLIFSILIALLVSVYYLLTVDIRKILKKGFFVSLAIVSISVLLSLLTFKQGKVLSNLGGILGYSISSWSISQLGPVISYAAVILFFLYSVFGLLGILSFRFFAILLGVFVSTVFFTFAQAIYFEPFKKGEIVTSVSQFVSKYIGEPVTYILFILLAILGIVPFLTKFKSPKIKFSVPSFRFLSFPKFKFRKVSLKKNEKKSRVSVENNGIEKIAPETVTRKGVVEEERPTKTEPEVQIQKGIIESPPMPQTDALIPLLKDTPVATTEADKEECERNARLIEEKLQEFGVKGKVVNYYPGPVVTRYEYEPAPGIKLSKIVGLSDDLALRMKSNKIRIIAPLPDKGLIGIEVPNRKRKIVYFKELVNRPEFKKLKSRLGFALGVDTAGFPRYADLAKMPHLLIAGATGSGKSVCINTLVTSILFRANFREVRFLMIDPKRIELSFYEGIPHLVMPVIKERKEAAKNLKKMVALMDLRYKHFAKDGVRDIESHNKTVHERPGDEPLPYIVVIIDEFADLILTIGKEVEEPLAKLAQMARAVGIHLVVATQRPSVDVITGMIKANFPVRIAFKVPSRVDSKTILDEIGAEKLLGMGDMLFIPPGTSEPIRLHGPFISEEETKSITSKIASDYILARLKALFPDSPGVKELVEMIVKKGFIPSLTRSDEPGLKERFEILISRAARLLKLPEDTVREKLALLKSTYYPEIKELEDFDLLIEEEAAEIAGLSDDFDPLVFDAARLIVQRKNASATFLQRRLKIGFARAARIIDQLEEMGIVGPPEGSKPRQVLVGPEELEEKLKKLME